MNAMEILRAMALGIWSVVPSVIWPLSAVAILNIVVALIGRSR